MAVRSSKGERLGFFHSFGNWLTPWGMPGAAGWGTHSYCPQLTWRRAVDTWGKVVGRSAGAKVPDKLRGKWPDGCGGTPVSSPLWPQVELPTGSHPAPYWWMAVGI